MGRLIDGAIQPMLLANYILERKDAFVRALEKGDNDFLFAMLMDYFDAQPTAYDLDKVVEQLKEEKESSYVDFGEYVDGVCPCLDAEYDDLFHRGLERAIEIVRGGGVDAN